MITTSARTPQDLTRMVDQRTSGTPLELQALARTRPGALVVDLCCGTAALGAVLATRREGVRLHAADIDAASVRCARRNITHLGGQVHHGDLFHPLPRALLGQVDVLVVNAPYVPTKQIALLPCEVREHEPHRSLDGGTDGLDVVRRIASRARAWLAPGAHLLVQAHPDQVGPAMDSFTRAGLRASWVTCPDTDTCAVLGLRPPA